MILLKTIEMSVIFQFKHKVKTDTIKFWQKVYDILIYRISNFQLLARKRTNNQQSVQNHQFIDQRTNARRTLNENISNEINKEASDVRDKYVRDQGMFGTKCKFGTSGNHFVAYVRDGQCTIQRLVPRKPQIYIRLKS